nr:hypothetical protein CFP56_63356 [Quercus suber]
MLECLDDLERRADGTIIARITSALDQQRRAWKQCQTLSSCHECCHKRSTVTLLTMSYERIVEFFHRALAEDLAQRPQELGRTLPGVTFGQYEVGTQDEVFAVLQALVAVRLKEMSSDVELMQSREKDGIRDLYKVRLRAVGDKVKDIAAPLRCLNCPEIA